jgi:hypothetical protein
MYGKRISDTETYLVDERGKIFFYDVSKCGKLYESQIELDYTGFIMCVDMV